MRTRAVTAATAACLLLGATVAGCGGSSKTSGGQTTQGHRGGTLRVLLQSDIDSLDPGIAYYGTTYMITEASQRTLYSYPPVDPAHPVIKADLVPDLADGAPSASADGRTITVHIKPNIRFSPPVNRAATSADVKYAIERGFLPSVNNGYATAYFGDIQGVKEYQSGKAADISGLQTPDDHTLVFKLDRPVAGNITSALVLPLTAPVPQSYAAPFDKQKVSQYAKHLVATGPYMVPNDASGTITGYQPGKSIALVRNPSWSSSSDFRPAYLDGVDFTVGVDPNEGGKQVIDGTGVVNGGDFTLTPSQLQQVETGSQRAQLTTFPSGATDYLALNTTIPPLDNINVRKAIWAALDLNALRLQFGGAVSGDIATHFISPPIAGFAEAGGAAGPKLGFNEHPSGDAQLAQSYLRQAGYPSGKYTGSAQMTLLAQSGSGANQATTIASELAKLGFKIKLSVLSPQAALAACSTRARKLEMCLAGWGPDFLDPLTMLYVPFNGSQIKPTGNVNFWEINDPKIDAAMAKAATITDPQARARAWGDIDRQITALAPGVFYLWENKEDFRSADVQSKINVFSVRWDLSYTSVR